MKKHNERCKKCKKHVFELLSKLFGEIKTNHNLHISNNPEEYINTPLYTDLKTIFSALQKERGHEQFTRSKSLPNVDFYAVNQKCIIEFDETQHFTRLREIALSKYPDSIKLGFNKKRWLDLCISLNKKDNDPPFRDEQRAWYDTMRDFAPLILDLKPTIRLFSRDCVWCEFDPNSEADLMAFKKILSTNNE